jgi:hypothetical protein
MDKRKVTYTEFLDESPMSGFLWLLVFGIFTLIILMASPIGCVIAMWIQNKMARTWLILLLTLLSTVFFLLFGVSFRLGFPIG